MKATRKQFVDSFELIINPLLLFKIQYLKNIFS